MGDALRFALAPDGAGPLLSLLIMRFCLGKCGSVLGCAIVCVICSCEKHRLGEMPEVQKEQFEAASVPAEHGAGLQEVSTSPTPAEFFPESHR